MKKFTLKEDNFKMILIRASNKVKKRNIWGFYIFIVIFLYLVLYLYFFYFLNPLIFFGRFVEYLLIFGTGVVFKMMLILFKINTSPRPYAKPTVSVFTHPNTLYHDRKL